MNWSLIMAVALTLTFSTIGDVCAKLWGLTNDQKWIVIGLPVNFLTILMFMIVVRLGGLAIPTAVTLLLTIVINVSVGIAVFGEQVNVIQGIGLALGIVAIFLIVDLCRLI
jgi:drug/metabolite transporter (DMT)-like permease